MAVTSLWAVRGNLGVVLDYAANPEKTDLMNLLRYATQQRKTTVQEEGTPVKQLVTGIHCAPATACQEMQAVKKRFGRRKASSLTTATRVSPLESAPRSWPTRSV